MSKRNFIGSLMVVASWVLVIILNLADLPAPIETLLIILCAGLMILGLLVAAIYKKKPVSGPTQYVLGVDPYEKDAKANVSRIEIRKGVGDKLHTIFRSSYRPEDPKREYEEALRSLARFYKTPVVVEREVQPISAMAVGGEAIEFLHNLYKLLWRYRRGDSSYGMTFYIMYDDKVCIGERMHQILEAAGIEHEFKSLKEEEDETA